MKLEESKATQVIAAMLLLFSLLLYFVIIPAEISDMRTFGVSPQLMPDAMAILLAFFSVWLFYEGWSKRGKSNQAIYSFEAGAIRLVLISVAALIIYQLAVDTTGFIITAAVFLAVLMVVSGQRNKKLIIAISIGMPVAIYCFFSYMLKLYLP